MSVRDAGGSSVHVSSAAYPAGHTSAYVSEGTIEVGGPVGAHIAEAWLDGVRLADRAMVSLGRESSTQFRLRATPGAHVFQVRLDGIAGSGNIASYRFSVSAKGDRQGRLVTSDGVALANFPVAIHAAATSGGAWDRLLGSTVTDASGFWTLPQLTLNRSQRKAAGANGGVLNVQAAVTADARIADATYPAMAVTSFPVSMAGSVATASLTGSAPIADLVLADPSAGVSRSVTSGAAVYWASRANFKVVGRVGPAPKANGDQDGCLFSGQGVKKLIAKSIKYSVVIEGHRSPDSFATVAYGGSAGTAFSVGVSVSKGPLTVSGTSYVGNTMGFSTGYTRAKSSKQWKVPIEYRKYEYWSCGLVDGIYKKVRYQGSEVRAYQYKVPKGGFLGKAGSKVGQLDDWYGYKDAPYKAKLKRESSFSLNNDTFKKESASASLWGFSFSAETSLSSTRSQTITAGKQKRSHYIFGWQPIGGGMDIFYAYS